LWSWAAGPLRAQGKKRKKGLPAWKLAGWARRKGERERGRGKGFVFFFKNFFQIHFSNIQTPIKQKSMHSNHDAQALIISKLF
jgi:hypothetical protein